MRHSQVRATPGIAVFAVFVFLLLAVPKANIRVGPIPVYIVDLMLVILLLEAHRFPPMRPGQRRFTGLVGTLFLLALASEAIGALTFGTLQASAYVTGRTILAFSVFLLTSQMVRTPRDVEIVLRAVVLGLLVTASLMILTSLPMTRGAVSDIVFSQRFLEPATPEVQGAFGETETGIRGRTLVGVSILGATFINVAWPLAALLLLWPWRIDPPWRSLALVACLLAPMGVLLSYSRGPILGSVLIVLCALLFGLRFVRRGVLVPVLVGTVLVLSVGVTSQIFFFDRLTNRSTAIFDAPFADERESERILAYIEPFRHLVTTPRFLVFGEGIAIRYAETQATPEQAGKATHAVFAMAYYSYGMIAAVLYIVLLVRALALAATLSRQRAAAVVPISQSVFLSLVALVPWLAFGHAAVSTPRGAMLFFFVLGLTSALVHICAPVRQSLSTFGPSHAQRHSPAFRQTLRIDHVPGRDLPPSGGADRAVLAALESRDALVADGGRRPGAGQAPLRGGPRLSRLW